MKKIILTSITIMIFINCYSQTEKEMKFISGQFYINGHSNNQTQDVNSDDQKYFSFLFLPQYGYFVKDNIAIGGFLNFGINNNTSTSESPGNISSLYKIKNNSINYGLGFFARKYFKISDKFLFFENGAISYSYQTNKNEYTFNDPNYVYSPENPYIQKSITNIISVSLAPGLQYSMTPKLGLTTSFGNLFYSYSVTKSKSLPKERIDKSNWYGINLSVSTISFGLIYYF